MSKAICVTTAALLLISISGCGGNNDVNAAGLTCKSLAGSLNPATGGQICTGNCVIRDAASASDGAFGSFATIAINDTASGTVAVRAEAKGSTIFPPLSTVGVIYEATGATQNLVTYSINTYLSGVLQDSSSLRTDVMGSFGTPISHAAITTTRPYDKVEFQFQRGNGSSTETIKVYEFCSD